MNQDSRSREGSALLRIFAAGSAGAVAVGALIYLTNAGTVVAGLHRALAVLPFVIALEGCSLACETFALYRLYGRERTQLSLTDMLRAALVGYPPMILLPAGRAVAEAVRAGLLSRRAGVPIAAAVAVQMQAVLLIATASVSFICAAAMVRVVGPTPLALAIAANGVVTGLLAAAVLAAGRRSRLGEWAARRWDRLRIGPAFDEALRRRSPPPFVSIAFALVSRLMQIGQLALLLGAIAGHFELWRALGAEGVHLVGASLGDLVPAQLGASDAAYAASADALGLSAGSALAIALLAHATQAVWCLGGALVPLFLLATPARTPIVHLPLNRQ